MDGRRDLMSIFLDLIIYLFILLPAMVNALEPIDEKFEYNDLGALQNNWVIDYPEGYTAESLIVADSPVPRLRLIFPGGAPASINGPGEHMATSIQSKNGCGYGTYLARLKAAKSSLKEGTVAGFFTYWNGKWSASNEYETDENLNGVIDNSEIDFEILGSCPGIIRMAVYSDYEEVKISENITITRYYKATKAIDLSSGNVKESIQVINPIIAEDAKDNYDDNWKPGGIKIDGFDASSDYYEYGFTWQKDFIRFFIFNNKNNQEIELWKYDAKTLPGGTRLFPGHEGKARLIFNVWHTTNWHCEGDGLNSDLFAPSQNTEFSITRATYEPISAEIIETINWPTGTYKLGDVVAAGYTIKNTGTVAHKFFMGCSVRGPDGEWQDMPYKITPILQPNEDYSDTMEWTVNSDAPAGNYLVTIAVWAGEGSDGRLKTELDRETKESAFQVDSLNAPVGYDRALEERSKANVQGQLEVIKLTAEMSNLIMQNLIEKTENWIVDFDYNMIGAKSCLIREEAADYMSSQGVLSDDMNVALSVIDELGYEQKGFCVVIVDYDYSGMISEKNLNGRIGIICNEQGDPFWQSWQFYEDLMNDLSR